MKKLIIILTIALLLTGCGVTDSSKALLIEKAVVSTDFDSFRDANFPQDRALSFVEIIESSDIDKDVILLDTINSSYGDTLKNLIIKDCGKYYITL